jgi:HAD superfamily hydrolase (TIGR01509 family)
MSESGGGPGGQTGRKRADRAMQNPDLIIFDYDGVIADSELLNNAALAEVLTGIGLATTTDEAIAAYMGKRWLDCRPLIEARLGRACPDDVVIEWTRLCHERASTRLPPVDGLAEFMADRPQARCIASSSPPDWIELGLSRFGLAGRMGPIFSAAVHVTRGKPHPDLFLHAAEAMGVRPARTVVIEDSTPGVLAGVAAGMQVIGLCAGGHIREGHAEGLTAAGAHAIAWSYDEVASLID